MAKRSKLELTWYNKDKALIPLTEGKYGYAWVESTDPRYSEYGDYVYGEVDEDELRARRARVLAETELRSEIKPALPVNTPFDGQLDEWY